MSTSCCVATRSTGHKPFLHGPLQRVLCFRQGLFQGFLREADCGVLVRLPSPVRPPPSPSVLPVTHEALRHVILHVLFTDT